MHMIITVLHFVKMISKKNVYDSNVYPRKLL